MSERTLTQTEILRDLGDGLVLRRATAADAEALSAFNALMHTEDGPDQPDERIRVWTRELLEGPHPTVTPDDFTVVEEVSTGRIVSSILLISQVWAYGRVPFKVGRPELVATLPEFRNRGLVRTQFEVVHQWSAERGQVVQAITGIPFYYRQFGYEMGLNLGGHRSGFAAHVPKLAAGEAEPFRLRPAGETDVAFVSALYDNAVASRDLITCVRTLDDWRFELNGRGDNNLVRVVVQIIETPAGEPVGYLGHGASLWTSPSGAGLAGWEYELKANVSWLAVTPSVIRYLWATGETYAAQTKQNYVRFFFGFGESHPAYEVCPGRLPVVAPAYAWYVRVPDLPGFLQTIAPVLEARLAKSVASGHTGELKLSFYRSGLRLELKDGKLARVEPWQPTPEIGGEAGFPNLTFLQLLFGYRSLDELRHAYADCWTHGDTISALLNALFPKQPSHLWALA